MTQEKFGPIQGAGIGLRSQHFSYILKNLPAVNWFEVLVDNFLNEGGPALANLKQVREFYPLVFHGVGLSIGSSDPLNKQYLAKLKSLASEMQPAWISDHLSWISLNGNYLHQLLPLPYTKDAIDHVADRVQQVQDYLQQRILLENVSSYLNYSQSEMFEWEFLNEVATRADCYILLDINNVYVSAQNQNFDPYHYLKAIDPARVKQFHLAGYEQHENYLLDTHSAPVADAVWELFESALKIFGKVPTLLEWDAKIPDFAIMAEEVAKIDLRMNHVG